MDPPAVGLLRLAYNALSAEIQQAVAAVSPDIRPSHGNVMEQLDLEDGLRLTDLASGAGMAPQSMGELVDQLEDLGYVERRPDPADRRVKRIYRTDKAMASSQAAAEAVAKTEEGLRELIGADRLTALKHDLARVARTRESAAPDRASG